MTRGLAVLLAFTSAVAVGNIYLPQAIIPLIAAGLHTSPQGAATAVTAIQAGYTAGMFLLVPLGDRVPHRRLLPALLALAALGLFASGLAPNLPVLTAACVLTGLTTIAAPLSGPLVAALVPASRRGSVLGTIAAGSMGGMLLIRTFSGSLGEWLGWRAPFLVAGTTTLLLAFLLSRTVPYVPPPSGDRYLDLLASAFRLLRTEPDLRRSAFYQATVFAAFSAVWTCAAFLLSGPAYGFGAQAVGLLALVGAASMVCTPLAGRMADRYGPDRVNTVCLVAVLASTVLLVPGARGGPLGLVALVVGALVLDAAMQSGMIANSARVLAVRPDARARLNTAFMTCAYTGGTVGSWLGAHTYTKTGWPGVCALAAALCALALTRHALAVRARKSA
ncbi:MFS transporter [Streptomyces sp. HUAS MG91]|uniref:MFS transporter n=1 Tax=Streptomyces tabacisoli TaxID=3156398 RepID=A0AAU8J4I6_9ACTN